MIDLTDLMTAIQYQVVIVKEIWDMMTSNFILSIPIAIVVIYGVLAVIDKLKKAFR